MFKFFKEFKNLELNQKAADLEYQVVNLHFSQKAKAYSRIGFTAFVALSLYGSATYKINQSEFKKALISTGVSSPFSSFFYSDFQDKIEDLKKLEKDLTEQVTKKSDEIYQAKGFAVAYKFTDFISDSVNQQKISVALKASDEFKQVLFYKYIKALSNAEKIEINGNQYSAADISQKVSRMPEAEALEALETPMKLLLSKLADNGVEISNKDEFKKALLGLSRFSSLNSYKTLKIDDKDDDNIKAIIANSTSESDTHFTVLTDTQSLKIPNVKNPILALFKVVQLEKNEQLKAEAEDKKSSLAKFQEEHKALSDKKQLVNQTISLIVMYPSEVKNGNFSKANEEITKNLSKIN